MLLHMYAAAINGLDQSRGKSFLGTVLEALVRLMAIWRLQGRAMFKRYKIVVKARTATMKLRTYCVDPLSLTLYSLPSLRHLSRSVTKQIFFSFS